MSAAVRVHRLADGPAGAPVLVLSNSLGASLEMWDSAVLFLAGQFRVIRYDMRGHGRSPVPRGPYAVADLGADLLALLDSECLERVHLAGLSLGGLTSMWLAAHAPERVVSLTVLSAPARFGSPERYRDRAALVRDRGTAAVAEAVVDRWFTPAFASANPDLRAQLREMIAATPAEGYAACCEAVAGADLGPDLASIAAPTLCLAAADDPAVPVAEIESLARSLPSGRLVVVPQAAHLQNVEHPQEIAQLIAEHVVAVSAAGVTAPTALASGASDQGAHDR